MSSRTKAKSTASSDSGDQQTAAAAAAAAGDTVKAKGDDLPLCGVVHTLPLLAHVTCQRPAGHPDDEPKAPDQGKHVARDAGALYVW